MRQRDSLRRFGLSTQRILLDRLLLLLLRGKGRSDTVAPLLFQINRILLVDALLFFLCRIRTCDVERAVLHEIVIGVAASRLAPAGEFGVALSQSISPCFARRPLFRGVRAFFEIRWRARPPLRRDLGRSQRYDARDRANKKHGGTQNDHNRNSPANCVQDCYELSPFCGGIRSRIGSFRMQAARTGSYHAQRVSVASCCAIFWCDATMECRCEASDV